MGNFAKQPACQVLRADEERTEAARGGRECLEETHGGGWTGVGNCLGVHHRLRALFQRESMEGELDEELRAHLEQQAEKYVKSGMPREAAARRARLEFGGVDQAKEECRDARGVSFIEAMIQDLRYGLRQLR